MNFVLNIASNKSSETNLIKMLNFHKEHLVRQSIYPFIRSRYHFQIVITNILSKVCGRVTKCFSFHNITFNF